MNSETSGTSDGGVDQIFAEFNKSLMTYWAAYIELQNQLYEAIRAAREVSWLAATDTQKISEINSVQRDLFASMPRRMDYMPLWQISRDHDDAVGKLEELQNILVAEKESCKRLEDAITLLKEKATITEEALKKVGR
jgi:hypothetical protein